MINRKHSLRYRFENPTYNKGRLSAITTNSIAGRVSIICENTGEIFPSIKAASEWFEIPVTAISKLLRETQSLTHYKGLAFDYKPMF